jgi:hypothetical protein
MLDDLRNSSSFIDEDETPEQEQQAMRHRMPRRQSKETFLGMTAQQRFILSLMMFFMVCALGAFALIITGSIVVPGL